MSANEDPRDLRNPILVASLLFSIVFIGLAFVYREDVRLISEAISAFIVEYFNWFYVLVSTAFLIYLGYLALSRFGQVVLGHPGEKPEFSNASWYAMLFSAGMGVGLLFWGVGEPLTHFLQPPMGEPQTPEAARLAMAYTSFHWGFHAWGIYTICAVSMAYYGFRRQERYLISSTLADYFQNDRWQFLRSMADLVSILAVVFGVAASLGLGVLQIASGLKISYGWEFSSAWGKVAIVSVLTVVYLLSASTGLKKGIRILSNLNMIIAIALLFFVFIFADSLYILKVFVDSIGQYLQELPRLSFRVNPYSASYQEWMGDWTLTYFTWWMAWAPFVGIFIARISKGRTIRELILGSLCLPAVFSIFWFSVFGGTAIHHTLEGDSVLANSVLSDVTQSLFLFFEQLPWSGLTSLLAIVLLFSFLVTSADSAVFVISMLTSRGRVNPPMVLKLSWGVLLGVLTLVLLLGGGLAALQAAALTFAFPFCIVLVMVSFVFLQRLKKHVEGKRL